MKDSLLWLLLRTLIAEIPAKSLWFSLTLRHTQSSYSSTERRLVSSAWACHCLRRLPHQIPAWVTYGLLKLGGSWGLDSETSGSMNWSNLIPDHTKLSGRLLNFCMLSLVCHLCASFLWKLTLAHPLKQRLLICQDAWFTCLQMLGCISEVSW